MATEHPANPAHLEPSKLGTKEYWDDLYTAELTNYAANPSDEGTVWFDDSDAEAKILTFLDDVETDPSILQPLEPAAEIVRLDREQTSFLDLGCGNGSLLFSLRDAGWTGRLLGVDYSEKSVALATQVARARADAAAADEDDDEEPEGQEKALADGADVEFTTWDVLNGPLDPILASVKSSSGGGGWDVVLDKGTFDAVSLSDETDARGRRICEGYRGRVLHLLRPGGFFLVTSCNWTEAELRGWFERDDDGEGAPGRLRLAGRVEYRSFSFGGVKGQTISTVCFVKVV